MHINEVLTEKQACTGCSSCMFNCPHKAIHMEEDKNGFLYPSVDSSKCIECGICRTVCPSINKNKIHNTNLKVFAAVSKNQNLVQNSSSGGIFASIADKVLDNGGVVYGCSLENKVRARHIRITNKDELHSLQGSKYIQSELQEIFLDVKKDLENEKSVLFSGTPCQINGLKCMLKKNYENLITIDLVCHGVPSYKFFEQYIEWFQKKKHIHLIEYCFRDNTKTDVSCVSRIDCQKENGKSYSVMTKYSPDYYFYYFYMMGDIYRESCYDCPCLPDSRMSDISLGDFWGIEDIHPEISLENGVSVVIIHTEKGAEIFASIEVEKVESSFEKAILNNTSITNSIKKSDKRDELFSISNQYGAEAVYRYCRNNMGKRKYIYALKAMFPVKLKRKIRKMIRMNKA